MLISGNNIGPDGARALSQSLEGLNMLTGLGLEGECYNGGEVKCMFIMFIVSGGVNVTRCACRL